MTMATVINTATIDLDALADAVAAKKARPCWVCSLPEKERLWVDKAIKAGRWSIPTIVQVLVDGQHSGATESRIKLHKYKHVR